jgi:hypothetical protein
MQASLAVGSPTLIYRGMSDKAYTLCPSNARHPSEHTYGDVTTLESAMLEEFKRLSLRELEFEPENEFEWLFLAQHHGLPTRLLDWSTNPLVGLYFSVEKNDDRDGVLYLTRQSVSDQYHLFDHRTADYQKRHAIPIAIQPRQGKVIFVRPRYKDRRYHNQASVFSCPAKPYEPLDVDVLENLESLIVPRTLKPALRERLRMLGVSASFIYPGLDGVAAEVKSLQYDPVHTGRQRVISFKSVLDFGSDVTQATLEKDKAQTPD